VGESNFETTTTDYENNETDPNVPIHNTNATSIAFYIIEYANTASTGSGLMTEESITNDVIARNPNLINVSQDLSAFYANKIPSTEEYKAIASVYNGKNLTLANCTEH
jgi:hypothetical protein